MRGVYRVRVIYRSPLLQEQTHGLLVTRACSPVQATRPTCGGEGDQGCITAPDTAHHPCPPTRTVALWAGRTSALGGAPKPRAFTTLHGLARPRQLDMVAGTCNPITLKS